MYFTGTHRNPTHRVSRQVTAPRITIEQYFYEAYVGIRWCVIATYSMFPVLSCSVLFGCLTSILQRRDVAARPKLLDSYHLSPGVRLVASKSLESATVFGTLPSAG